MKITVEYARGSMKEKTEGRCYICKKFQHMARDCPDFEKYQTYLKE